MTLTYGSLFTGIGGFDLGFDRAGMQCLWQCEIDPWCCKVLEKHWPGVTRYGDIKLVDWSTVARPDVLCGGFPCQPHSLAGKRKASSDERDLWPEFYRAICELRPAWVVAENVRGLLSSENGRFFGGILRDLARVGYDAEWQMLSAEAFGAPHIRQRVWIVAYPNSRRCSESGICAQQQGRAEIVSASEMADAGSVGRKGSESYYPRNIRAEKETGDKQANWITGCGEDLSDTPIFGREWDWNAWEWRTGLKDNNWWAVEPAVGRVANGIPGRVDRLKQLGNAIVPQVAEWIGSRIVDTNMPVKPLDL